MKQKISKLISHPIRYSKLVIRPDVIAAVIIIATVSGVTVNTSSVIMQNYQLERDVRVMEQKVAVAEIELETQKVKNQYYATDYYLDIAARKQLSKGAPGEKLIIVPRSVAEEQLPAGYSSLERIKTDVSQENLSNFRKWQLFLTGDLR